MADYLHALIYGIVQGIAEYLPISSSAHLILLPRFLGTAEMGLTFDVFLHLGTLAATLSYFWREWIQIGATLPAVGGWFARWAPKPVGAAPAQALSWKLIAVGTIPALIAGAALNDLAETVFRANAVLVCTLPLGGLFLYLADRFCPGKRPLEGARWSDALWVGVAQCVALIPGMSRSGSTMIGGRLVGFDRADAARFSFLLSAPITAAATVFEMRHFDQLLGGPMPLGPLLVAGLSSFVFGYLAIGGLLKLLRRFGFLSFAIYRAALALVILWQLGL